MREEAIWVRNLDFTGLTAGTLPLLIEELAQWKADNPDAAVLDMQYYVNPNSLFANERYTVFIIQQAT